MILTIGSHASWKRLSLSNWVIDGRRRRACRFSLPPVSIRYENRQVNVSFTITGVTRSDWALPQEVCFPEEEKKMESEDPLGSGVRGGRAVFYASPMEDLSRRRPPMKGLLLFVVSMSVSWFLRISFFLSPLSSNLPHLWRILVSRQYEREFPYTLSITQGVPSRDKWKNIWNSFLLSVCGG